MRWGRQGGCPVVGRAGPGGAVAARAIGGQRQVGIGLVQQVDPRHRLPVGCARQAVGQPIEFGAPREVGLDVRQAQSGDWLTPVARIHEIAAGGAVVRQETRRRQVGASRACVHAQVKPLRVVLIGHAVFARDDEAAGGPHREQVGREGITAGQARHAHGSGVGLGRGLRGAGGHVEHGIESLGPQPPPPGGDLALERAVFALGPAGQGARPEGCQVGERRRAAGPLDDDRLGGRGRQGLDVAVRAGPETRHRVCRCEAARPQHGQGTGRVRQGRDQRLAISDGIGHPVVGGGWRPTEEGQAERGACCSRNATDNQVRPVAVEQSLDAVGCGAAPTELLERAHRAAGQPGAQVLSEGLGVGVARCGGGGHRFAHDGQIGGAYARGQCCVGPFTCLADQVVCRAQGGVFELLEAGGVALGLGVPSPQRAPGRVPCATLRCAG